MRVPAEDVSENANHEQIEPIIDRRRVIMEIIGKNYLKKRVSVITVIGEERNRSIIEEQKNMLAQTC